MRGHERYEELISASVGGDLSGTERRELEAHLRGCAACRETRDAWAGGRRLVAGLRHQAPPRDLSARVRTGIERGHHAPVPWWRRPAAVFTALAGGSALVAGALLGLQVLNAPPSDRPVGATTAASPSTSLEPTPTPLASVALASATPVASAEAAPTVTPVPEPTPQPEPSAFLALSGPVESQTLTVNEGVSGEPATTLEPAAGPPVSGPPIAAALSPSGEWVAYLTRVGEKGTHEVRVSSTVDGESLVMGESVSGSPFLEQLAWSPDGSRLAFSLTDPEADARVDVWTWQVGQESPTRITDTGNAFVGSWSRDGGDASLLWVSLATEEPASYLLPFPDDATAPGSDGPVDPSDDGIAVATAEGIFQPLLNADGSAIIYWRGSMQSGEGGSAADYYFAEGGAPYIANGDEVRSGAIDEADETPLFADLSIGRDAFRSAAIAWGPDGDAYAVWAALWTGTDAGSEGAPYPDSSRVYFSRASDDRSITRIHALDEADVPEDGTVIDVAIAPTGRHLALTVQLPIGGVLDSPRADLYLITRNTGNVADGVAIVRDLDGWNGPAIYPVSVQPSP